MALRTILNGLTLLHIIISISNGQLLKLKVEPPFEFVNENWTIGRALPSMSVCVQYSGARSLSMVVSSGDPFAYFQLSTINDTCWALILQKSLDADIINPDGTRGQSFSLAFRCSDGKIQAYGNADVQVVDINDNAPIFVDTKSAVSVAEDAERGKVIFTASTFDPDTGVGGINSFRLEDDYKGTFQLRNGSCFDAHCTADIILNDKLNYDVKNVYTLTIIAFDGAGRSKVVNEARFPVVVTVLDVENNPPKFLVDNRVQFVAEDAPTGSEVFHVFAYDGDAGVLVPRAIRYSLSGTNAYFGINSTSGWVYVKKPLDRESPDVLRANGAVNLVIVAEEEVPEPEPRPSSSLNVTIIISDVDDEPPRCNLTRYTAQVAENSQRFVPITLTNAIDLYVYDNDEAANGEFNVSLVDHEDVFDVTPKHVYNVGNLLIRVLNSTAIDYETRRNFDFKVVLTPVSKKKSSMPSTYCDVNVVILDVNDNKPQFNKSFVETRILENQSEGTLITEIPVYDLDTSEFAPIILKLSGVGSEIFYIDEKDGGLKTSRVLDREKKSDYTLTITAVDENGRGNSNSATIRVVVMDENDNAPQFTKDVYTAYLPENGVNFMQLSNGFFVEATDADEPNTPNSNVTYTFEEDAFGAENFRIDAVTGQIVPLSPGIDLESMPANYLNFTVVARDQSRENPLSSSATVLIYVNDTNDNAPNFSQLVYRAAVYENATSGTFVTSVTATDNDRSPFNSLVAYRIVDVQDKFSIDSQSGQIVVASGASLDRDLTKKDQYRLTVVALDQGVPPQSGNAALEIKVIDINDKVPKFTEKIYSASILEDVPVGTFLTNVTAFDTDVDANLVYKIVGGSSAKLEDHIKRDTDNFGEWFRINEQTGEVYTAAVLDRELVERIVLIVSVTDENGIVNTPQTAEARVEIVLLDVNDNAPQFSRAFYSKSLLENAELGSTILTVTATDKDQNGNVVYAIEDPTNTTQQLVDVGPTSGEITVLSVIDYEQIQWINFTIVATDSGVPPLSNRTYVIFRVMDQNDNSPVFHPSSTYAATLSEDSPPDTFVIQVCASDADSGLYGRVSYFLLNDLETTPHFAINETTGAVYVVAPLDREIKPEYALTIRAVDDYNGRVAPGSHESTAVVRVTLTDVNDNAPQFASNTPKLVALTENNAAGAVIVTLAATDKDDQSSGNGQVQFSIVDGNGSVLKDENSVDLFTLDSTTGALRLASNLTGWHGLYWLTIEARDQGEPPMSTRVNVTIKVQDYNDHKPAITTPKAHSTFVIPENNYSDFYVITKINAVDADEGVNAELHYALKQTSTNEDWKYFHLDTVSGDVFPRQAFDFERQNRYELTAEACDYGQPSLCDQVEFAIVIVDENDNCPLFKRPLNYTHELQIKENLPVDSIIGDILEAMDKDTRPENTRVCYSVVGGIERASFRMARPNGTTLLTTASLDRERRNVYDLVVKTEDCQGNAACSQGAHLSGEKDVTMDYHPADSTLLLIKVTVLDDNDHEPFFLQPLYRGGVRYDTKIGSRVTRVRADDMDTIDSGRLVYYLHQPVKANLQDSEGYDSQKSPFLINETTGDITTNILFQPSWKGNFEISVAVKDLAEHSTVVVVLINLLRYDQQLELIFEAPVNQVWDEAHDIAKYLSITTNSNATIDDVLPYQPYGSNVASDIEEAASKFTTAKRVQSKVLVHFVDESQTILAIDSALQLLDRPRTVEQKQAKHHLISVHHLRYAAQNSDPAAAAAVYKSDAQTLTALAGVVGGLVLVMSVLIATWCIQSRTYKRKLKAASTLAFSSNDMIVPAYDLPGTNLHANSNPVWSPDGAHFSFDDQHSPRSGNDSLDDNDLAYQIEKQARESPVRNGSTGLAAGQFFMGASSMSVDILKRAGVENGCQAMKVAVDDDGDGDSDDADSNGSLPPPPAVTMQESNRVAITIGNGNGNGNGAGPGSNSGSLARSIRSGMQSPQLTTFPRPLMTNLESTEL